MTVLAQARRGGPGLDAIIESLARGETGLAGLIDRPRLVAWLDERRRSWVLTTDSHPATDTLVAEFRRVLGPATGLRRVRALRSPAAPTAAQVAGAASRLAATVSPAAAALAASDRDGHVRELAVAVMAARPAPELMPFLLLRCGDWVAPVRDAARSAVTVLLTEQPETYLPAAVPMAAHTSDRRRGRWTMEQAHTATAAAFDRVATAMLASRVPARRRLAYTVGTELGRWSRDDLVRFALREPDSVIRVTAADAASAIAGKQGDVATLRVLAGARFAQVRAAALVELARLGLDDDVAAAADDPAALVRALGRTRVPDPAGHYRAAVAARPAPAVIAGLGETGGWSDEALLAPLLGHDDARIRAAAVKALAALDSVPVDKVLPLLRDPVAGVVREAAAALRPYRRRLPEEVLWRLLGDTRPEVRRGAYRIIRNWDPASALRAARMLAGDDDPQLAQRGRDDVRRWERIVIEQRAG